MWVVRLNSMTDSCNHIYHEECLDFVADYACEMLASGANTLRAMRCTYRIADAVGVELEMSNTARHIIMSVHIGESCHSYTRVVAVPDMPVSFERTADLSTLSWEAYDKHLSLDEIRRRFDAINQQRRWPVGAMWTLISLGNAAFCYLFGGDALAMLAVFVATFVGFGLKKWLVGKRLNIYLVVVAVSFVASIVASISLLFDCDAATAIATSPLFLVPGVPLINGIIDIVEGHVLVGISRLTGAMMIILCIAIGLSCTLMLVKGSLL